MAQLVALLLLLFAAGRSGGASVPDSPKASKIITLVVDVALPLALRGDAPMHRSPAGAATVVHVIPRWFGLPDSEPAADAPELPLDAPPALTFSGSAPVVAENPRDIRPSVVENPIAASGPLIPLESMSTKRGNSDVVSSSERCCGWSTIDMQGVSCTDVRLGGGPSELVVAENSPDDA